jgi:hypothetical protein
MLSLAASTVVALGKSADIEICQVLAHGGAICAPPKAEVAAVATVTLDAVPAIARAWKPVLSPLGYSVRITGVFCHSTPKVTFTSTGPHTCELGDLLVVVDEMAGVFPNWAIQDRRAVLVQAKVAKSRQMSIHGSALHQLDLYRNWHSFTVATKGYDARPRDFTASLQPGHAHESGRYGGIDLGTPKDWMQVLPVASPMSLSGGVLLGQFMAEMLGASSGREAIAGGADDWSFTVDELLRVTAVAAFTHVPSLGPGKSHGRGQSAFVLFGAPFGDIGQEIAWLDDEEEEADNELAVVFAPDGPPPPRGFGDEPRPEGPVSTIHIQVTRSELEG